ncbi:SH3 domain-containing protein [Bacillus subtilis]|uniref:SH3 domain-containing protein n=1 Tax=Bacillus subtilis group TaxID=653685 RepID=UPI002DB7B188|nr:SH3 domain-containing protein [Bacillus mojavensis]MEC1634765.1 SH3 domain-containing protein [Bacillus mojavensis]
MDKPSDLITAQQYLNSTLRDINLRFKSNPFHVMSALAQIVPTNFKANYVIMPSLEAFSNLAKSYPSISLAASLPLQNPSSYFRAHNIFHAFKTINMGSTQLKINEIKALINKSYAIQKEFAANFPQTFEEELNEGDTDLENLTEEVFEEVNHSLGAISNPNALTREEFLAVINDLFSYIKQLIEKPKTPAIILVGIFLCNHVLNPVTEALTNKFIIEEFIEKKPETTKEAKAVLKEIPMEKELKKNYRMVTKETLVVRSSPKTNSNVLYVLNKSEIVAVKEKKRNWSLVLFLNEEGESQQGWVFTRYIKKIDYTNK